MRSSGSSLAASGPRESVSLRLGRFAEGDLEAVLDPAALPEVQALLSSADKATGTAEPGTRDLLLAGELRWARYLAQDPAAGREDLLAAVGFFARVHQAQPDAVPPPVREALESPAGPRRDATTAATVESNPGTVLGRADVLLRHAMSRPGEASYEAAIEVLRPCLAALGPDDPWRPRLLGKLSIAMMMRYNQVKSRVALEEMIDSLREILAVLPDGLDPVIYRAGLAQALWWRAMAGRDAGQLDEAIGALRAAISEVRARAPDDSTWLPRLERGLRECEAACEAVLVPGSPGEALRLSNQALALLRSGGSEDAALRAIGMLRRAAELTPDWPNRAIMLVNLSSALLARGRATGSADLLAECRAVLVEAVDHGGPDSADKPYWPLVLANLALASGRLYWLSRDPGMAGEAMRRMREALAAAPEGSPAAAVDTAAPRDRLAALRLLGGLLADDHDWAGALDAYRSAIALLTALPARYLSRADQEYALRRQSGLATEAAACALRRAAPAEAVQLLEMGRGVMLAQALESRSDVTDLRSAHPELAGEFARLRDQLAGSPSAQSPGVLLAGFESAQRAAVPAHTRTR
jgi:tetratricopeptide (TPR) repeat protein